MPENTAERNKGIILQQPQTEMKADEMAEQNIARLCENMLPVRRRRPGQSTMRDRKNPRGEYDSSDGE